MFAERLQRRTVILHSYEVSTIDLDFPLLELLETLKNTLKEHKILTRKGKIIQFWKCKYLQI